MNAHELKTLTEVQFRLFEMIDHLCDPTDNEALQLSLVSVFMDLFSLACLRELNYRDAVQSVWGDE